MKSLILVVDDEISMREFLCILLEREGYETVSASSAEDALRLLGSQSFDLIISDVSMPGLSGVELLGKIRERNIDTAVLLITAYSSAETAVEAMKKGAYDYIAKPFKVEEIKVLVSNALENRSLKLENRKLKQAVDAKKQFAGLVGKSRVMLAVYELIEKVAAASTTVLITGESGTGKEIAAWALHRKSRRSDANFIPVNCGAIPETLMESELFGYSKGSFTGADKDKPGLFEQASGGTIFLDEIGEIPLHLQAKLLRVLQDKEVRRVGSNSSKQVDVRVIAATNRNLEKLTLEGGFREDLFYRLNVIEIHLPPLRERKEDVLPLLEHFGRKFSGDSSFDLSRVEPDALKLLMDYEYPGNVRELENIVERAIVLSGTLITHASLPRAVCFPNDLDSSLRVCEIPVSGVRLENILDDIEKGYLEEALKKSGGVKTKAAELLGLTFRSFRYRLAKYGLEEVGEI